MIARNNRPVATLKPYSEEKRNPDIYKGRVFMSDDFDDDLPEDILQGFYS